MTEESKHQRIARIMVLANGYSPLLRDELLSRPEIVERAEIETDATITLGAEDLSFRRSDLFPAINQAFDGSSPSLISISGEEWTAKFVPDADPPNVALVRDKQRLIVAQFALLAPLVEARLAALQTMADRHRLPGEAVDRWRELLSRQVPNDHDLMLFREDLRNTPAGVAAAIREGVEQDRLTLDTLVPDQEEYYRQLVGGIGPASADGWEAHLAEVVLPFLKALLQGGQRHHLNLAWLICAHQSVSPVIAAEWKGEDQTFIDSLAWLTKHGDPLSRTGAIEVGLRLVGEKPSMEKPLADLIRAYLDGEPSEEASAFDLLAALFHCIYGHMARRRILADWPPFARRLAALAHASLVCRNFASTIGDRAKLIGYLHGVNEGFFILQCFADLRSEPRWLLEFGSATQVRNELLGRVWLAANGMADTTEKIGLTDRLLGKSPDSLPQTLDAAAALLPGPLEGAALAPAEIPKPAAKKIKASLKGQIDTTAFTGLINGSLWMRIPDPLIELAVDAVERCHHQIPIDDRIPLRFCLQGLASLSAISRNIRLSDAVFMALRVTRRLSHGVLSVDDIFRTGMMACAAHADRSEWVDQVGNFALDLALDDLNVSDAEDLHSHITTLCHIDPELWGSCGQALAALSLVIGK